MTQRASLTDEQLLVRMTWGLVLVSAMAAVLVALALQAVAEVAPTDRDRAGLWVWAAFVLSVLAAFPIGWRHRYGNAPRDAKDRTTPIAAGVAVALGAVFLTLPVDVRATLLGAGGGYFAGLVAGVACGVAPRWVAKWRGRLE